MARKHKVSKRKRVTKEKVTLLVSAAKLRALLRAAPRAHTLRIQTEHDPRYNSGTSALESNITVEPHAGFRPTARSHVMRLQEEE